MVFTGLLPVGWTEIIETLYFGSKIQPGDGYRVLARNEGGHARLVTRNGIDLAGYFPEITSELAAPAGSGNRRRSGDPRPSRHAALQSATGTHRQAPPATASGGKTTMERSTVTYGLESPKPKRAVRAHTNYASTHHAAPTQPPSPQ